MNWFEEAIIKKARMGSDYSYMDIAMEFGVHYDTVRKRFKKYRESATGGVIEGNVPINISHDLILPKSVAERKVKVDVTDAIPLQDRVMSILQKGATLTEISEACKISPLVLSATLQDIKDQGFNLFESGDFVKLSKIAIPSTKTHELSWDGSQIVRYGIVSDTHLCSKSQQLSHLNSIYDTFAREDINTVLHIGDLVEGINMRKGHEYELFVLGFDGQADYAIEKYPRRDGIITKFITGNHDHTGIKSAGADIGRRIVKERNDMEYLGLSNARIKVTPNCTMELNHGLDGASYALSYTLQKCIDAFDGSDLPDIFLNGHHHKLMYTYYRSIHALECFLGQTKIETIDGRKQIKDIKIGDLVLTHENRYKKVVKLFNKMYGNDFIKINFGRNNDDHSSISCTTEHPILINRKGKRTWTPASEILETDKVYVKTKECKHCGSPIPYYRTSCNDCISTRKTKMQDNYIYKNKGGDEHYKNDILPRALELQKQGFKVFPIGEVVPDIIAIKDGKLVAIEVEDRWIKHGKKKKYDNFNFQDEVEWEIINKGKPLGEYSIDEETGFCYVDITSISKIKHKKPRTVYNISVEDDNSYIASNVVVHNCGTFQAQTPWMRGKRLAAHVGGLILTLHVDDNGKVKRFIPEFIPFYSMREKDY